MLRHRVLSEVPLSLAYALGFFGTTVMPGWIGAMALRYGTSVAHVGLVASLELGCVAIASGLSAIVARSAPGRAPLILAVSVSVLANTSAALAPSLPALALIRGIAGAAHGFILADVTRRAAHTKNPSRVFASQLFALVAMAIVFFANAPVLGARWGFAAAFLFYAAMGALTLVSLIWLDTAATRHAPRMTGVGLCSRVSATMQLSGATLLFCIQTSLWAYLQPAATSVGMSMDQLSRLLALGAAINLLAPIAAERLGERIGRTGPFLVGFAVLGTSTFLIAGHVGVSAYAVGVVGLSFSTIFLGPFVMASLLRLDSSGRTAAGASAFFMIGLAVGPALGAFVLNSIGLGGLAAFGIAAALTSFLLFVCSPRQTNNSLLRN
jgi:predicted MFS family arabinose efflux permease